MQSVWNRTASLVSRIPTCFHQTSSSILVSRHESSVSAAPQLAKNEGLEPQTEDPIISPHAEAEEDVPRFLITGKIIS